MSRRLWLSARWLRQDRSSIAPLAGPRVGQADAELQEQAAGQAVHRIAEDAADAAQPDHVVGRQERQDVVQRRVLRCGSAAALVTAGDPGPSRHVQSALRDPTRARSVLIYPAGRPRFGRLLLLSLRRRTPMSPGSGSTGCSPGIQARLPTVR